MRNLTQLSSDIDSVEHEIERTAVQAGQAINDHVKPSLSYRSGEYAEAYSKSVLRLEKEPLKWSAVKAAVVRVRDAKVRLQRMNTRRQQLERKKAEFEIHYHKIWAHSAACLVMILIGAPLGAIIKKGGLGLPVLISIAFFIISYVINMQCEKYAKQNLLDPFLAMWMSNVVLLPVGLFLMWWAQEEANFFYRNINIVGNKIKLLTSAVARF